MAIMHDTGGLLPRDAAMNRPATPEEQKAIEAAVQKGLDEGALGLGMGITYTPTATPDEILNLFYLAAKFKRPVFVHMRAGNVIASLQEVITDAAASGAPLHIVHMRVRSWPRSFLHIAPVRSTRSTSCMRIRSAGRNRRNPNKSKIISNKKITE
jgi:hypothetical protein